MTSDDILQPLVDAGAEPGWVAIMKAWLDEEVEMDQPLDITEHKAP